MRRWAWTRAMTRDEWCRLAGFGGAVGLLHLVGWGLFLYYARSNPALAGLGTLAYTFGLRHAFDADHIAAIDNTTRKLLQDGKRSLGVGFFFSLGHSTIVFSLAAGPRGRRDDGQLEDSRLPGLRRLHRRVASRARSCWIIGLLNLLVLLDIARRLPADEARPLRRAEARGRALEPGPDEPVLPRRVGDRIDASWKMYPLGILFGLGFDTATEIGLLALAAGVATHHVPFLAVDLAADHLRRRHVPDGHRRRRLHEPGLRLGVLEPDPQGLLQHHRHEPLGRGRAR